MGGAFFFLLRFVLEQWKSMAQEHRAERIHWEEQTYKIVSEYRKTIDETLASNTKAITELMDRRRKDRS